MIRLYQDICRVLPRTPSSFIGIKEPKELHLRSLAFYVQSKYKYYFSFIYSKKY